MDFRQGATMSSPFKPFTLALILIEIWHIVIKPIMPWNKVMAFLFMQNEAMVSLFI